MLRENKIKVRIVIASVLKKAIVLAFLIALSTKSYSQDLQADSTSGNTQEIQIHSPHKAAMYSALVPGMGQAYNKKYWKIPVVYGLTGIFIYYIDTYNTQYNKYLNAYIDMENGLIDEFEVYTSVETLEKIKDNYLRNRDISIISLAAVYLLNILDATVDGHLYNYEVNEDLTFNIQPEIQKTYTNQNSVGFSLSFKF